MIKFADVYHKVRSAVLSALGRKPVQIELTPEQQRKVADLWLAKQLKAYILKSSGEKYAGVRWPSRKNKKYDEGHALLIKTGRLYRAIKNSTVTVVHGKKGQIEFIAEVEDKPYPGKEVTTKQVFLFHQHGTPKMPARPIITELSQKDQRELDEFIQNFKKR